MNLAQCKLCGRLFNSVRSAVCAQCAQEMEELHGEVKEYIRESPKKTFTVEQVARGMNVDVLRVQTLVDIGYLSQYFSACSDEAREENCRKERLLGHIKSGLSPSCAPATNKASSSAGASKMYGQGRYRKAR